MQTIFRCEIHFFKNIKSFIMPLGREPRHRISREIFILMQKYFLTQIKRKTTFLKK